MRDRESRTRRHHDITLVRGEVYLRIFGNGPPFRFKHKVADFPKGKRVGVVGGGVHLRRKGSKRPPSKRGGSVAPPHESCNLQATRKRGKKKVG